MLAEILITSALNRKAASSNEVRVLVLGSTKKFTSVFPRNAGTFLISRAPTCLNASAVSRTKFISSAESSRSPSRSFRVQRVVIVFPGELRRVRYQFVRAVPIPFRFLLSAGSFRRNQGESGVRDARDQPTLRAGCGRVARMN